MLTLITGTPGAGKSLYAVWKLAKDIPGSTVEENGQPIPRRLFSNIKNLLVEHTHIDAQDLDKWHTWAKPGDVILFDEVQEVWRPRGLGTKVPDCIAKLETHRHMGVDIILVTQHPMLVDPNIRRLVNRHIHMRRLAGKVSMVYEWDHCSNPNQTKTCIHSALFWFPKEAFDLYKSAQVHTKPTTRVPKIAYVGLIALVATVGAGKFAYTRATDTFQAKKGTDQTQVSQATPTAQQIKPAQSWDLETGPNGEIKTSGLHSTKGGPPASEAKPAAGGPDLTANISGCIQFGPRCECIDKTGFRSQVSAEVCRADGMRVGALVPLDMTRTASVRTVTATDLPATIAPSAGNNAPPAHPGSRGPSKGHT